MKIFCLALFVAVAAFAVSAADAATSQVFVVSDSETATRVEVNNAFGSVELASAKGQKLTLAATTEGDRYTFAFDGDAQDGTITLDVLALNNEPAPEQERDSSSSGNSNSNDNESSPASRATSSLAQMLAVPVLALLGMASVSNAGLTRTHAVACVLVCVIGVSMMTVSAQQGEDVTVTITLPSGTCAELDRGTRTDQIAYVLSACEEGGESEGDVEGDAEGAEENAGAGEAEATPKDPAGGPSDGGAAAADPADEPAPAPAPAPVVEADPSATGPWPEWRARENGVFRSSVLNGGEFVYTNGIIQSRGANTDGIYHQDYWGLLADGGTFPYDERQTVERHLTWSAFGVDRWATDGDQELPLDDDAYPEFTSELAELRLITDDDELFVRLRYNSFPAADTQIASLVFATEGGSAATAEWPHGAGVSSPWSSALTVWGTGASVTAADGTETDLPASAVRVGDHTVEVRLPKSLLPSGPWQLWGGAGLTDPADRTQYWEVPAGSASPDAPGSGFSGGAGSPVWSLLFARDPTWEFSAKVEGDLLAAGDATPATVTVDPAMLDAQMSRGAALESNWFSRQYVSAFDFGDGILKGDPDQNAMPPFVFPPEVPLDDVARTYEYTGRLQPYGMYVPEAYHQRAEGEKWPLLIYLHGLNNFYYEPFGTLFNIEDFLEENKFIFANLLGRGDYYYLDRGELDVREVIADIKSRYDIDDDRMHIMGHSMGSIGSHNFVTRNPDWFASGAPAEITASNDLVVNLQHVPWIIIGGAQDFLDVNCEAEYPTYEIMSELGYDITSYCYLEKTHESNSITDTLPQMFELHQRSRRVVNPGTFTYKRLSGDDFPDLGIVHDGAYQASLMTFADESADSQITVESFAIPHSPLDPASATRTNDNPIDEGGFSGRSIADKLKTVPAYGPPVEVRNAATVTLDNVGSVTLDTAGLSLEFVSGLEVTVSSSADTAITFTGAGGKTVLVGGLPAQTTSQDGDLTVSLSAGDSVITVA